MALNTYSTGTVSVTAGGTTVTGSGTIWSGNKAVAGDEFVIGGVRALIVDVVSVTELTITPWPGSDESGASYAIYQTSSQRFADVQIAIDAGKIVDALNTEGFYIFVPSDATAPDPSLGDDGQYAFQATTGKLWLKENGVWTFLGIYKGFNFRGAYDADATYSVNDVFTDSGSAYIVTSAPPVGTTPPNATYYDVLAAGGTDGADGAAGAAATVAVGTTTTGAAGTDASVTNSGTSSAAVLDFTIPTGATPLKPIEAWVTGTDYVAGPPASFVSQGGSAYECLVDHTSGTFATDLAAGKWGLVASKGTDGAGTGDVQGPASSTDGGLVVFDGTDGKHVKALVDAAAALTELGGTTVGKAVFSATDAAAAQSVIGQPDGAVIQFASAIDASYQSGTTNFAFGDNAPTNTEGTEILTCSITPKSTTNKLIIRFNARVAGDASNTVGVALFVNGTSTSISAEQFTVPSADAGTTLSDEYVMTAGTTSALTFSLRVGCASSHTWYVNGTSAGRRFGGTMKTAITVTEIKA